MQPAYGATLEEAQAALLTGQQEVIDATQALADATADTASKLSIRDAAQAAVNEAQTNYDTNLIPNIISASSGLAVDIYNNIISRTPEAWQLCRHDTVNQIAANWGGGSVMGCGSDWVTVHYYGTFTVPTSGIYYLRNVADDGFYMTLDGVVVINEWRDKGCGGNWYPTNLQAGHSYVLDAWFYENGGGACSTLYYINGNNSGVIPASWFGQASKTVMINDPSLLLILQDKQASLTTAESDYQNALLIQAQAQTRLNNALAAIPILQQTVYDLTPRLNAPTLVSATLTETGVDLVWTAPENSNVSIERYAISWSTTTFTTNGWGWNHDQLSITIPLDILSQNGGLGNTFQFEIRADNNTQQVYSSQSNIIELNIPAPVIVTPPVIEPTPEPTPSVVPEPTAQPTPTANPSPIPTEIPVIIEPTPMPTVEPTKEPVVPTPTPTVEPTPSISPSQEPTPTPSQTTLPTPEPSKNVIQSTPTPEPSKTPETQSEPQLLTQQAVAAITTLVDIKPEDLSDKQISQLVEAANVVFESAQQGSPEYNQALEALAVAAKADDPVLPAALQSIPGAAAVLETFNNLGNIGADMAPKTREEAKKTVIASVIAAGAAVNAVSAAAASATSSGGGTSSRRNK